MKQESRMKKQSKGQKSGLIKKLDDIFSKWVRLSNAIDGFVNCFTCGKNYHWKKLHAGHFMSRTPHSTRWDERNVNPQCFYCNIQLGGNQFVHGRKIDEKHGEGTSDELFRLSKTTVKYTPSDLQEKIAYYERLVNEQLQ